MNMNSTTNNKQHRAVLQSIAFRAMRDRGLLSDFSAEALAELAMIYEPATMNGEPVRDLRDLLWASIDNDDSCDLDQLTVAQAIPGDKVKILVAVADVDSLVTIGSAIDDHACHNTTSVYTAAMIFPMLPEKLSTNLTSLNFNEDRLSIVVEMVIEADGSLQESDIYRACVRNQAKLTYNSVAAWLEGSGIAPEAITAVNGLAENLRLQDRVAQSMKNFRHTHGALSLETIEARPIFDGDEISDLEVEKKNRAKEIIEDFMITVLITQRLLKAALAGNPLPYENVELEQLAQHCTKQEDAAKKVERQVEKSAAAILMASRIGVRFDAIVTGASDKGTWVRLLHPPIEGRLVSGFEGMDVGVRLRVELSRADVQHGYIDFTKVR